MSVPVIKVNKSVGTVNPNVRFRLPNLPQVSNESPQAKGGANNLNEPPLAPLTTTTSTTTSTTRVSTNVSYVSPMLSPKFDHLTLVKPPLSTSIDKQSHALHKVIQEGRLTQLKYFLEMGLNPNCVDREANKRSCLMLACMCEQVEYGIKVTRVLLKHGADLNAQDGFGRTVLYYAVVKFSFCFFFF